jgi:hypothetical protein
MARPGPNDKGKNDQPKIIVNVPKPDPVQVIFQPENKKPQINANYIAIGSVLVNIVLAFLTFYLYREASAQSKNSNEAIRIANETKLIETSPIIGVINVRFDSIKIGRPITAHFTIINVGRAPAFINQFMTYFDVRPFMRIDSFEIPNHSYVGGRSLQKYLFADSRSSDFTDSSTVPLAKEKYDSLIAHQSKMWFRLHVYYSDQLLAKGRSIDFTCYNGVGGNFKLDEIEESILVMNDTTFARAR